MTHPPMGHPQLADAQVTSLRPHARFDVAAPSEFVLETVESLMLYPHDSPFLERDVALHNLSDAAAVTAEGCQNVRLRAGATAIAISREHCGDDGACFTIIGPSAAWIWTGGTPPPVLEVGSRKRMRSTATLIHRRISLTAFDVHYPAGIATLSPERTFIELANSQQGAAHAHWLEKLTNQGWVSEAMLRPLAATLKRKARGCTEEQLSLRKSLKTRATRVEKAANVALCIEKGIEGG